MDCVLGLVGSRLTCANLNFLLSKRSYREAQSFILVRGQQCAESYGGGIAERTGF
jgi:hypothetical protein